MIHRKLLITFILFAAFLPFSDLKATTCSSPPWPSEVSKFDDIFLGNYIADHPSGMYIQVEATKVYKGYLQVGDLVTTTYPPVTLDYSGPIVFFPL